MTYFKTWCYLALGLILSGCGATHVVVKGEYPEPLTNPLPFHAGLIYSAEFLEYSYQNKDSFGVVVELGASQKLLFDEVLSGMFLSTAELGSLSEAQQENVGMVIVPSVEEVQLALPRDTQLEVFELWIKFNIQVFDGEGEPIADWIMTGYGKTVDKFLSSKKKAINQAAQVALRDTGAQLVTKFHRVPGVRAWLASQEQIDGDGGS